MIDPGLYRHYKNHKLYRVLFTAEWAVRYFPGEDALLHVYVANDRFRVAPAPTVIPPGALFSARWSGNSTTAYIGEPIVIYVALYDDGRVAARPLAEFTTEIQCTCAWGTVFDCMPPVYTHDDTCPCGPTSIGKATKARFERIGD